MEAIIPLVALFSLGLLAIRFGADSRPAIRSDEHRLADAGVMWPSEPIATSAAPASRPDTPQVRHVLWTSAPTARRRSSVPTFPTLEALDRAREPGSDPFATDPNAARLEGRARQLTDEHWSEWVWLIGRVDQARFDLVCNALDHERHVLRDARQRVEDVVVLQDPALVARGA